ncbi:MAG: response regulator transcription factor [Bacteroidales bacterium]|jgi:DNA-binding NarL/FixJ family response regulator|nr:response regulator transcription factor [Bacteroidales bacterium]
MQKRPFILADNQDITREGLLALLHQMQLDETIIWATSRNELLPALKKYPNAAIVLDYTLFDFSSVNEIVNIKGGHSQSSWLLFSDELGELFLRQILFSGQSFNIVMKTNSRHDILMALESTVNDEEYLCELARLVYKSDIPTVMTDILTPTEKIVLHQIALGKTTKEIAYEKNLSFHTVNAHRKNIFRKLEVNNVHEAIKYALRAGIINVAEYCI